MDFKSFLKNRKVSANDKQKEEALKERLKKYEGKSQEDVMTELMRAVEKGKADGTLSSLELENFYTKAAPMLTEEQKRKMREIIDKIK
ncbi:MAG: hypothetical protein LBT30_00605 [Clostridiales bacterium]|jgi:ABC-type amino acid transport substrate-binding protein|nr:hypothetical protein [Clostridiales bacterium]